MSMESHTARHFITVEHRPITNMVMDLIQAYRKMRERRRSIAQLRAMDNHMLKDIGIARGEIRYIVLNGRRQS